MANDRRDSVKKMVIDNLKEALDPDKTYDLTESTSFADLENPQSKDGKKFSQTSWLRSFACKNFYELTALSTGYEVVEEDQEEVRTVGEAIDAFMAGKKLNG